MAHWFAAVLAEQAGDEPAMARDLAAALETLAALPLRIADLRNRLDNAGTTRLLHYHARRGECALARAWRARWYVREGCGLAVHQLARDADCVVASRVERP